MEKIKEILYELQEDIRNADFGLYGLWIEEMDEWLNEWIENKIKEIDEKEE